MATRTAAELLRAARSLAELTQAELAVRARVPQSVISAYERGRRQPAVDMLSRLVGAAGFELALTERTGPDRTRAGRDLIELLALADALPDPPVRPLGFPPLPRP